MSMNQLSLTCEPLISPTLWLTLLVVLLAAAAVYAWRRPAGLSARRWAAIMALNAVGWMGVLAILLNPTWLEALPPPAGKPLLTVLLDASSSMATRDVDADSRFAAGRGLANDVARKLSRAFDVQIKTFAAHAQPADAESLQTLTPQGELTDLAAALHEGLAWDRPQGQALLLLSDGVHNGPGGVEAVLEAARIAKSTSTPVWVRALGGQGQLDDVSISLPRPQELAYVGQKMSIPVRLKQRGRLSDQFEAVLRSADEELSRQTVRLAPDGEGTVKFDLTVARSGIFRYEVAVASPASEAVTGNNVAPLVVRVVREPIRVLVLEGKPYWDTKFLLRTLSADAMLEVDSLVRLTSDRFLRREMKLAAKKTSEVSDDFGSLNGELASFQRTDDSTVVTAATEQVLSAKTLSGFQVIVLGRDAEVFLTSTVIERLRNWLARDGGSLVCFRGSPVAVLNQQLAAMMPVRWSAGQESRFHPRLTDRGLTADWLSSSGADRESLSRLPSLAMRAQPGRPSPLSVVLAESGEQNGPPVVTYQPYGTGRVVTVEGAGMWRWAFLAPNYQDHDELYSSLWQSLVRWLVSSVGLAPGQDLLLRTDRVSYREGESVSIQVLAREDVWSALPPLQVHRDGELLADRFVASPVGDELGVFQVNLGRLPEGRYRVCVAGADEGNSQHTVMFDVLPFLNERLDISARHDILARVAQETEGAVLTEISAADFTRRFQDHLVRTRPSQTRRITAWDRWWMLLGILGAWSTAWTLRRMGGLV
jgi:hypothetical protein